jgi:phosphoribosylaminoimidazole carboxylase PurE protein
MSDTPQIILLMGSDSDLPHLEAGLALLRESGVAFEVRVLSAHRTPEEVRELSLGARGAGVKVLIAAAGAAAHLAGAVAASTTLPVIGVPIPSSTLAGLDALLATVQMPGGVPVATVGIGKAGGVNAVLLALSILSVESADLARFLADYRKKKAMAVFEKDTAMRRRYAGGADGPA